MLDLIHDDLLDAADAERLHPDTGVEESGPSDCLEKLTNTFIAVVDRGLVVCCKLAAHAEEKDLSAGTRVEVRELREAVSSEEGRANKRENDTSSYTFVKVMRVSWKAASATFRTPCFWSLRRSSSSLMRSAVSASFSSSESAFQRSDKDLAMPETR